MRHLPVCAAIALTASSPTFAHHSDAGLDMENVVIFEGTIKEFFWRNPHVYFTVETTDGSGELVEWALQMGSTITVSRMGWNRSTLMPGDRVVISAHPATDGRPYGYLDSVEREGGLDDSGPTFREPEVTVASTSLEGRWMSKLSEVPRYPGGIDGFFIANLDLTDKAREARDSYDPFSAENPEARCIGRPSPGMIVSSTRYPMEIEFIGDDIVELRGQYWDEVRTVYMDGREHPDPDTRFPSGHSIGHWDGDTLVVDTRNFTDHRSPYQIGVPSGGQKNVVERYTLIEGGTRIAVDFVLSDPEYLATPMVHARELVYVPQVPMEPFECSLDATRMFMRGVE